MRGVLCRGWKSNVWNQQINLVWASVGTVATKNKQTGFKVKWTQAAVAKTQRDLQRPKHILATSNDTWHPLSRHDEFVGVPYCWTNLFNYLNRKHVGFSDLYCANVADPTLVWPSCEHLDWLETWCFRKLGNPAQPPKLSLFKNPAVLQLTFPIDHHDKHITIKLHYETA